jgi:hypothetical protein
MRTRLFLSWSVVPDAAVRCTHPSGYCIEKAAPRSVTKTWLSGMSPDAADFASADSAPGDELVAPELPDVADPELELEPELEDPHPAARAATPQIATMTNRLIAGENAGRALNVS